MAFEVTAARRRPRRFNELAGQNFVVSTLSSSIRQQRIAHAYLFSGPRGVGKTSAARILAKSLNCETGMTTEPCGTCASCVEIAAGSALDVIEIDGASNTSVNDVRAIKDEVLFAPGSCRYKIYIIDEVHMLSNSAFNALLKTIEEPPPYVIFIFATTEIHKVPATIRSRCQQFHFQLISLEVIRELLQRAAEEGGLTWEPEALFWIAKEATGSLRDAYTLFDQIVSFSDGSIRMDLIREKMGIVGTERINTLAGHMVQGSREKAIEFINTILSQGVSVETCIIDLCEYFRCLLLLKEHISKEQLLGARPEDFSPHVLDSLSVNQIEAAIDLLLGLYRNLRFSLNPRFELELAISKLCSLPQAVTPGDLIRRIETLQSELINPSLSPEPRRAIRPEAQSQKQPVQQKTPDPLPQEKPLEAIVLTAKHFEVIESKLKQKHPSLASALSQLSSWKVGQDDTVILYFSTQYTLEKVRSEQPILLKQLQLITERPVRLEIRLKEQNPKNEHVQRPTEPARSAVDMTKEIFRGELFSK